MAIFLKNVFFSFLRGSHHNMKSIFFGIYWISKNGINFNLINYYLTNNSITCYRFSWSGLNQTKTLYVSFALKLTGNVFVGTGKQTSPWMLGKFIWTTSASVRTAQLSTSVASPLYTTSNTRLDACWCSPIRRFFFSSLLPHSWLVFYWIYIIFVFK